MSPIAKTAYVFFIGLSLGLGSLTNQAETQIEPPTAAWLNHQASTNFSGVILVARHKDILYEQGLGFADRENQLLFTTDTVIDVLSLTKQFTAAAILKLEEQGVLSVNDTLDRFFSEVPADKKAITLHQLLTHTSGLKANHKWDYRKVTRDELEKSALNSRLVSAPGEKYHYSNLGYSLLGIIIENASGQGYEQFLHQHLFIPAGMTQTGYRIPDWTDKHLAVGYRSRSITIRGWFSRIARWLGAGDRWGTPLDQYWAEDGPWWNLRANGGMLSTLNDLYLWHLALESQRVLSEASLEKLYAPHVKKEPESDTHYAYGWNILENQEHDEIYHTGGNPYFFSLFYRSSKHDFLLLYATNDPEPALSGEVNELILTLEQEFATHQEAAR